MSRLLWSYQSLSHTIILISLNCILILVPATRSSERSQGVKYDSCTGISNILQNYSQKLTKCFLFNFGDNPNPNRGSRAPQSRPSQHHQWCSCSSFYQNTILLISCLHCSRFVCLCYRSVMRIRVWDDGMLQPGTNEHHTLIIHGCKDDTGLILSLARVPPQTRISPTSSPCIDPSRLA